MKTHHLVLVTILGLATLPALFAGPGKPPPLPARGKAPLLYVLFSGPAGLKVTFYQGAAPPRDYPVPVTVGLRPGYVYRVKVSGFPDRPHFALYPTLEVRGTLCLPAELNPAKYPAPVYLNPLEAERVLADGSLLTKVIYLEHPDKALAEVGRADRPLEVEVSPGRDLLNESRNYGRPVLVVRAGDRHASEEELQKESVHNTILFPGEKTLGAPARRPHLPWACFQYYDPLHGPRRCEEECLEDGGDRRVPAGFDRTGRLRGLDPEDTLAEYRDSRGRKRVVCSNKVCVCVPRFAALRSELRLDLSRHVLGPGDHFAAIRQQLFKARQAPRQRSQVERVVGMVGRQSPSGTEGVQGPAAVGRVEGLDAVTTQARVFDVTAPCREQPKVAPDLPLCLHKWSDVKGARIGDVVTFFLKYTNQGGQPISDVVVSDSLTGRLEYVPGSAETSRNAIFTTQPNESGSQILRWQITGRLLPGESGLIRFQVRVR